MLFKVFFVHTGKYAPPFEDIEEEERRAEDGAGEQEAAGQNLSQSSETLSDLEGERVSAVADGDSGTSDKREVAIEVATSEVTGQLVEPDSEEGSAEGDIEDIVSLDGSSGLYEDEGPGDVCVGNLSEGEALPGWVDVRCDRATKFGNPFIKRGRVLDDLQRDTVCEAFDQLLRSAIEGVVDIDLPGIAAEHGVRVHERPVDVSELRRSVEHIADQVKAGSKLRLMCWCHPERCHAQSIAQAVRVLAETES
jgi:hypothetical protein